MQHVVPNKRPPINVIITSSNIDRFSKLFHQLIRKIEINKLLKFSAQLKRVTSTLPCEISNFKIEVKSPQTTKKKFKVNLKVISKTSKKGISFVFSLVFTALIKSNQIIYLWLKQSQDAKVWKKTLTDTFKN